MLSPSHGGDEPGLPTGEDDLSIGERSFAAALNAGEPWTLARHRRWCEAQEPAEDPDGPITIRAAMIRAILFVEGAHMAGCAPPSAEAERLKRFGLDPKRRHLAQALVIDWVTDNLATVDRAAVEKDMEAKGAFEDLPEFWTDEQKSEERKRRIDAERRWRAHQHIANRPVITGNLNFTGGRFAGALVLRGCVFQGAGARTAGAGDDASPVGVLTLDRAVLGGLDLTSAALGALSGDRLRVEADFQAWQLDAHAADLRGVLIRGGLYWQGARLLATSGRALNADAADIGADVLLRGGFRAAAEVNFVRARIGGHLACDGGRFEAKTGRALNANAAEIGASVFLYDGFRAAAEVDLVGARIAGQLSCRGGRFEAKTGRALNADAADIGADVLLYDGFRAAAEVNLLRARIGGQLACDGGRFEAKTGRALNANAAEIGADVLLRDGFRAAGEVNLVGSRIAGQMSCVGGRFEAETGRALNASAAEIGADVFLRDGFHAAAEVSFLRARIAGNLNLSGGQLAPANRGFALDLDSARIGASLMFALPWSGDNAPARIAGDVDLSNARCAVLDDAPLRTNGGEPWLAPGKRLILDGFTYGRLGSGSPTDWPNRKAWLDRQPETHRRGADFKPQPSEHVAQVLRAMGHNSEARSAGLIKQHRMHMRPGLPLSSRLFRRFVLWPSGYGYRPQFPALVGALLMAVSLFIFASAYRQGFVTPAQPHAALAKIGADVNALRGAGGEPLPDCLAADLTEAVPPFNAGMYVIDAFVPLVDIDQESSWKPARTARCEGDAATLARLDTRNPGWAFQAGAQTHALSAPTNAIDRFVAWWAPRGGLLWLQWLLMIAGFAISALIAASLSGLIRRD